MKSVEELIETKNWSDLSPSERALIADLATNEEEFYQAKNFFESLQPTIEASRLETSSAIKSSLDKVFQAKHPGLTQAWEAENTISTERKIIPIYQHVWFRIAAVLLIGTGFSILFWKTSVHQTEAKHELAMDTNGTKAKKASGIQSETTFVEEGTANTNTSTSNIESPEKIDRTNSFLSSTPGTSGFNSKDNIALAEMKKAESTAVFAAPTMSESVSRGMDKDLDPYANDELTTEQRERPRATENYFDLIEPSF